MVQREDALSSERPGYTFGNKDNYLAKRKTNHQSMVKKIVCFELEHQFQFFRLVRLTRELVHITRGPGFDPQLSWLNFSTSLSDFSAFVLSMGVLEMV